MEQYKCVNETEKFWNNFYLVSLDNHTGWDSAICVNADNEQDALDTAADYCEQMGWVGYFVSEDDLRLDDNGEEIDTIRAGNHGLAMNIEDVQIKRINDREVTFS